MDEALREVRLALLDADVALPVVKDFIAKARDKATGEEVLRAVKPSEQVVKIVHDGLVDMLGGEGSQDLDLNVAPPAVILMAGLQGSGKTTTSAKLAARIQRTERKRVLMASLDTRRPAAMEQLASLGKQTEVETLPIVAGQSAPDIARRALSAARLGGFDVVILDTAGRTTLDEARGGAALSMRQVTSLPIKFLGAGEKLDALEAFDANRVAGRILGSGDIVALVERAATEIDQARAEKMARKMAKGVFDLDDLADQLRQMQKMGGMQGVMGLLPGVRNIKKQIADTGITDKMFKRQEAIITSMTPFERKKPDLLNASRKRRIAKGSGVDVAEVNRLLKQHRQMADAFKAMSRDGGRNLARMAQAMGMGGPAGLPGLPKGVTPPAGMMGGGGLDLNALKALGGGKLAQSAGDPSAPAPGLTRLPGLGGSAPKFPTLGPKRK